MEQSSEPIHGGRINIYSPKDEDEVVDSNRIRRLIDRWLVQLDRIIPDALATRKAEKTLHLAIKKGPYFGKILSFAGLCIWVDDRTKDDKVKSQESINL